MSYSKTRRAFRAGLGLICLSLASFANLTAAQQTLTYGAIPILTSVQVGRLVPVENLDVSSLRISAGEVRCKSPYSITNQSGESRLVMVKMETKLPKTCALSVQMEERPGLKCTPPVLADGIDRHLVVSMARGSYDGNMYFRMSSSTKSNLRGAVVLLYTMKGG